MSATVPTPERPGRGPVVVELIAVIALFVALTVLGFVFFHYLNRASDETQQIVREMREEIRQSDRQNVRLHRAILCVESQAPADLTRRIARECSARFLKPGDLAPADAGGGDETPGNEPGETDPPAVSESPDPTPPDETEPPPDSTDEPPPPPTQSPSPTIGCLPIIGCI